MECKNVGTNNSHEGTHNLNPRVGKTKVIKVAANNIGHEVTNNLKPFQAGKNRTNGMK